MRIRRKQYIIATALAVLTALSAVAAPPGTGWAKNDTYSDNFNYWGNPNGSKWKEIHAQDWWKDGKGCWYHRDNVLVNGNALEIRSNWMGTTVPSGYYYSGGRVDSQQKMLYGWYECRSRLDWMDKHFWSTFWLWEWRADGSATEFDVMEFNHWHSVPSQSHHYRYKTGRTTMVANQPVQSWHQWGLLWFNNHVSLWINGYKRFDSENPTNAAGDSIPMIITSSPNRDYNPVRTGNYPRFFVDWVEVWKGGTVGTTPPPSGTSAPVNSTIALQSVGNGKYACADGNLGWNVVANRGSVGGSWEKFVVVSAGGDYIALKSLGNNKYVSANMNNGGKMVASSSSIAGDWEKYQWMPQSDGTIALKCGSGKYVCADGNLGWQLTANRSSVGGSWEKFRWSRQ